MSASPHATIVPFTPALPTGVTTPAPSRFTFATASGGLCDRDTTTRARDRIVLPLEINRESGGVHAHHDRRRLARGREGEIERAGAVDHVAIPTRWSARGSAARSSSDKYRGPAPVSRTSCSSCSLV